MRVGENERLYINSKRLVIVPPELAHGKKGVQEIPPNATIEGTKL
ncbi:hypothetical protein HID58_011112, partial [Brassica napus]